MKNNEAVAEIEKVTIAAIYRYPTTAQQIENDIHSRGYVYRRNDILRATETLIKVGRVERLADGRVRLTKSEQTIIWTVRTTRGGRFTFQPSSVVLAAKLARRAAANAVEAQS